MTNILNTYLTPESIQHRCDILSTACEGLRSNEAVALLVCFISLAQKQQRIFDDLDLRYLSIRIAELSGARIITDGEITIPENPNTKQ